MLISLLLGGASTGTYVHSLSQEFLLINQQGGWAIPLHHDGQWRLAFAKGGDLQVGALDISDMSVSGLTPISGRSDLRDHSLRRCPDGSYLWLSQSPSPDNNPAWRLRSDFSIASTYEVPVGQPARTQNDGLALCMDGLEGFGFAEERGEADFIYPLGAQAPQPRVTLESSPRLTGAGVAPDPRDPTQFHIAGFDKNRDLIIATYGTDLTLKGRVPVAHPLPKAFYFYWPTGFIPVGGGYLVLSMGRDTSLSWIQDQGNLYLWILDANFALVDWLQVTNYAQLSEAAMRPWLAIHEDQLLIAADRFGHPLLFSATVDLEAMAALGPPQDTAAPGDTANRQDSAAPDTDAPPEGTRPQERGCRCMSTHSSGGLAFLSIMLAVAASRRTPPADA